MTKSWILVANASQAHLYEIPRAKLFNGSVSLHHVADFMHPASREKDSTVVTDKLGHNGHGTFVEKSVPKMHEVENFAKELINCLEKGRKSNRFQDLILVAPPKFHGILKSCLQPQGSLYRMLSVDVKKDYTRMNKKELTEVLQEYV